jgi:hypothetical protein
LHFRALLLHAQTMSSYFNSGKLDVEMCSALVKETYRNTDRLR